MREQVEEWLRKAGAGLSDRDRELLRRAAQTLEGNLFVGGTFPWDPYRCVSPCMGHFDGVWNWDSAFHAMGLAHWDAALGRESLLGFLRFQREDGMLPDVIWADGSSFYGCSKPPVMAQAAEAVYRRAPDRAFLAEVYPALTRNARYWMARRCQDGLLVYGSETDDEDADQNRRFESGWDDSVRWDGGIEKLWPIDLNCFMVMFDRSMAYLARELGLETEARGWQEAGEKLAAAINERMWNADAACYADTDCFTGAFSPVLSPACFMPLYAGIAPRERASAMAKLAADPQGFYPGMPTVAYGDPQYSDTYWRGPTWLNVAYFAIKGLRRYGFSVAEELRQTLLDWCATDKRGIFENYRSRTGIGQCCDHFSWSAAFIVAFLCDFDSENE